MNTPNDPIQPANLLIHLKEEEPMPDQPRPLTLPNQSDANLQSARDRISTLENQLANLAITMGLPAQAPFSTLIAEVENLSRLNAAHARPMPSAVAVGC